GVDIPGGCGVEGERRWFDASAAGDREADGEATARALREDEAVRTGLQHRAWHAVRGGTAPLYRGAGICAGGVQRGGRPYRRVASGTEVRRSAGTGGVDSVHRDKGIRANRLAEPGSLPNDLRRGKCCADTAEPEPRTGARDTEQITPLSVR